MLEDTSTEVVAAPAKKPPRKPRPSEIAAKAAKKAKPKKAIKKTVGRPFLYPDMTLVRMPKGTLKRVHAACKTDEGQGDFMRAAIMTELKRRRK
jgi:hypothetical protein